MMGQRTHQLVICVDIEGFSGSQRSDAQRSVAHEGMYRALRMALDASGVEWSGCYHEDRGDGALVLVPPHVPKDQVLSRLPAGLAAALAEHNHLHAAGAEIRLRVAVHAGEVRPDEHGVVGDAVNFTFRLLEGAVVKEALSASPGTVAVIVSEQIFLEVIRHTPASDPKRYRRVEIAVKETQAEAWLYLPDGTGDFDQAPDPQVNAPPGTRDDRPKGGGELPVPGLHAKATGHARIYQAGHDMTVTER